MGSGDEVVGLGLLALGLVEKRVTTVVPRGSLYGKLCERLRVVFLCPCGYR